MKALEYEDIAKMNYVQLVASMNEVNRPPGGKDSIRQIVQNCFINSDSRVLDVGCNTGYSTFEIAHLAKSNVTGVDISPEMIAVAKQLKDKDMYAEHIDFVIADGMELPFKDESFDVTMSGGSTAFISDKIAALKEYSRVTKTWGFIADINFFYKEKPPANLLEKLNRMLDINIQPWDKAYWTNLYKETGLESYYSYFNNVKIPSEKDIQEYCDYMTRNTNATSDAQDLIRTRFTELMTLFAENHRYLAYGVFILRKRDGVEQPSLFGS